MNGKFSRIRKKQSARKKTDRRRLIGIRISQADAQVDTHDNGVGKLAECTTYLVLVALRSKEHFMLRSYRQDNLPCLDIAVCKSSIGIHVIRK